jgi:hypothetical protein
MTPNIVRTWSGSGGGVVGRRSDTRGQEGLDGDPTRPAATASPTPHRDLGDRAGSAGDGSLDGCVTDPLAVADDHALRRSPAIAARSSQKVNGAPAAISWSATGMLTGTVTSWRWPMPKTSARGPDGPIVTRTPSTRRSAGSRRRWKSHRLSTALMLGSPNHSGKGPLAQHDGRSTEQASRCSGSDRQWSSSPKARHQVKAVRLRPSPILPARTSAVSRWRVSHSIRSDSYQSTGGPTSLAPAAAKR